jgi:uncharacterized membrane protein YfcA
MDLLNIFLFFGVSFLGGAINSVAGGGTFLTFPVFILNGLSPLQANVMSTVALCPGSMASAYAYRSQLDVERKLLKAFLLVNLIGSIIGTAILLILPEITFEHAVPWLLLFATLLFTFGGKLKISAPALKGNQNLSLALQLVIAIYGGYFGAGQGILMLAMLQILGFTDIHRMNALKVLLGSAINIVAMVIFIFAGKVIWPLAPVMIVGAIAGGYLGAHGAQRVSPQKVRLLVSAIGFIMTLYFFFRAR